MGKQMRRLLGEIGAEKEYSEKAACPNTFNSFSLSGSPFSWPGFSKPRSEEANLVSGKWVERRYPGSDRTKRQITITRKICILLNRFFMFETHACYTSLIRLINLGFY